MSSTSISSALGSSSSPQPTSNGGSNSGNSGPQKNGFNNLTFVIIFFVLLVVFVGVGTVSRRRFMARRNTGIEFDLTMDDDELTAEEIEQARPVLYELGSNGDIVETGWKNQKPLSATLVKSTRWTSAEERLKDETLLTTHDIEMPVESQSTTADDSRRFSSLTASSWRRRQNSSQPKHTSFWSDEDMRPVESTEALEVAVMIAMPSPERSKSALHQHEHEGNTTTHSHSEPSSCPALPEYEIGMMIVPWHAELKRESIPISPSS